MLAIRLVPNRGNAQTGGLRLHAGTELGLGLVRKPISNTERVFFQFQIRGHGRILARDCKVGEEYCGVIIGGYSGQTSYAL